MEINKIAKPEGYKQFRMNYYRRRIGELEAKLKTAESVEEMEVVWRDLDPLKKEVRRLDE